MNFRIGEDIICITNNFKQVFGKPNQFEHPMKNELVTVKALKENWVQLEQYATNNAGLPLFFTKDKFRKLTLNDDEAIINEEEYEIQR